MIHKKSLGQFLLDVIVPTDTFALQSVKTRVYT